MSDQLDVIRQNPNYISAVNRDTIEYNSVFLVDHIHVQQHWQPQFFFFISAFRNRAEKYDKEDPALPWVSWVRPL